MGYNERWRKSTQELIEDLEDLENLEIWLIREYPQIYSNWHSQYYNE